MSKDPLPRPDRKSFRAFLMLVHVLQGMDRPWTLDLVACQKTCRTSYSCVAVELK
jgi:hypothetical protein